MSLDMEPKGSEDAGRSGFTDRWKSGNGRPSSFVYIVLGIGVLTLTILLAVIYFSASERERASPPICTDISLERAKQAILDGEVERMTVVYDDEPQMPTSQRYGPVLAKLDNINGACSNLPQGVVNQEVVYTIAGVIGFYNETTEGQQVEITYQQSASLEPSLFVVPTAIPTVTPTPPPTIEPTEAIETPVAAGTPVADGALVVIASPAASPEPRATPDATVSATP